MNALFLFHAVECRFNSNPQLRTSILGFSNFTTHFQEFCKNYIRNCLSINFKEIRNNLRRMFCLATSKIITKNDKLSNYDLLIEKFCFSYHLACYCLKIHYLLKCIHFSTNDNYYSLKKFASSICGFDFELLNAGKKLFRCDY